MISIWLLVLAVMARMKTGIIFMVLIGVGVAFLIVSVVKNIKFVKQVKKPKKMLNE
jgi:hypothetical protein